MRQPELGSTLLTAQYYNTCLQFVKKNFVALWDVQGTSYPPEEDKMYDMGLLSEAQKKIQGQGLAPAAVGPIRKTDP